MIRRIVTPRLRYLCGVLFALSTMRRILSFLFVFAKETIEGITAG